MPQRASSYSAGSHLPLSSEGEGEVVSHVSDVLPADVRGDTGRGRASPRPTHPCPVYTPEVESDFFIYTDASAYGWGAISISPQLCEPLALRKAIAALVPTTGGSWLFRIVGADVVETLTAVIPTHHRIPSTGPRRK
jgi:hypothetical protein